MRLFLENREKMHTYSKIWAYRIIGYASSKTIAGFDPRSVYLLNASITDLCQPPLEGFCLRGWDGLNDAKDPLGISAVYSLMPTFGLN